MKKFLAVALASYALAVTSSAALAATLYTAGTEFNGNQGGSTGVWKYGRLDGVGGTLTEGTLVAGGTFTPGVFNPVAPNRFTVTNAGRHPTEVGADYMHPGCVAVTGSGDQCVLGQAFANLRFTAPTAGTYTATFKVKLADLGNNPYPPASNLDFRRDGVRMLLNSDFKDLETWDPNLAILSFQFQTLSKTVDLIAGQTIDFSVDPAGCRTNVPSGAQFCSGPRYNLFDSTAYEASVFMASAIPEPASWAMLIAGFGLTGAAMRRRRVTAAVA